jgi:hypothetical protein
LGFVHRAREPSVILTENPPTSNPSYDNFDTSSYPNNNCTPLTVAPTVTITVGGVATTLADTSQRPEASRVAAYKAWQKVRGQVRKREHGIRILAPCRVKVAEWEGSEERGSAFRVVGFRCVSVFDIS